MLSILMYEDVILRKDIGAGIGGQTGRYIGGIGAGTLGLLLGGPLGAAAGIGLGTSLGGQLGRIIGKGSIDNPDAPADLTKASHRIGYLAKANTEPVGAVGDLLLPGAGGSIYGGLKNAISDNGAKKLGYDGVGRAAYGIGGFVPWVQDVTPLMGAFKPSKIPANR